MAKILNFPAPKRHEDDPRLQQIRRITGSSIYRDMYIEDPVGMAHNLSNLSDRLLTELTRVVGYVECNYGGSHHV